jgi:hypothetical protein
MEDRTSNKLLCVLFVEFINLLLLIGLTLIFSKSARTSKKTQHFTITKINWLMLFKETMPVYTENHTKARNTKFSVTGC